MYELGEFLFDTEHSAACHSALQGLIVVIAFVQTFNLLLRHMYSVFAVNRFFFVGLGLCCS